MLIIKFLYPFFFNLYNVFHMSQLRKYISDPFHVIRPDTIQLKDTITFDAMFI